MQKIDPATEALIHKIAREHCYKVFGYFDQDDLKNEIWIICLEALREYRTERGKLEHFLRVTVHNRLTNKFKDVTKSVRSPCLRCKYYAPGKAPSDCKKFGDDRHLCSKWYNYQLAIESRNNLLNATEDQVERELIHGPESRAVAEELSAIIRPKLNKSLLNDYDIFAAGGRLSKQRMKKLKAVVLQILDTHERSFAVQLTIKGIPRG